MPQCLGGRPSCRGTLLSRSTVGLTGVWRLNTILSWHDCGIFLVIIWWSYGDHMVIIWWLYGDYMVILSVVFIALCFVLMTHLTIRSANTKKIRCDPRWSSWRRIIAWPKKPLTYQTIYYIYIYLPYTHEYICIYIYNIYIYRYMFTNIYLYICKYTYI